MDYCILTSIVVTIRVMLVSSDSYPLLIEPASATVALVTSLLSSTTKPERDFHTPIYTQRYRKNHIYGDGHRQRRGFD